MIKIGSQNAENIENSTLGTPGDDVIVTDDSASNDNFDFDKDFDKEFDKEFGSDISDDGGIEVNIQDAKNINNFEIGTPEDDRLKGSKSQGKNVDILVGIDGQDVLVGNKGSDRFLLGKTDTVKNNVDFGISDGAFYDQAGNDDYALIKKFDSDQDIIELIGKKSNYSLGATSGDLPEGTGIFKGDELLGIIAGETDLALKDSYFEV